MREPLRKYIEESAISNSGYAIASVLLELVDAQKAIGVRLDEISKSLREMVNQL